MAVINIDGLPTRMGPGGVLKLLIEVGGLEKSLIGKIEITNGAATIDVADARLQKTVKKLDKSPVDGQQIAVWVNSAENHPQHFEQLEKWLQLESQAEKTVRHSQTSLLSKLVVRSEEVGLGERFLVELGPRNTQQKLPWTRFSTGSPVLLLEDGAAPTESMRGIVSRLRRQTIEVALSRPLNTIADKPTFSLYAASDEQVRRRMQRTLSRVAAAQSNRTAELRAVLLGEAAAHFNQADTVLAADISAELNPSQQAAVRHALSAEDVAVIHGPPGTGKTTTLVAIMRSAVKKGQRVLACAPSNMAVDNLCEALLAKGNKIVRLGHPARVLPAVQPVTLDALVADHVDFKAAKKYRREAYGLQQESRKYKRARPEKGAKNAMRDEAKDILKDAQQLEQQAVVQVLDSAEIILATLTSLDSPQLGQRHFDLCVIDEAGQSTETATWMPVPRTDRLILAGDHQQLPPTVISENAEREGYAVSLLEQLMRRDSADLARQLTAQYRMHEQIMGFSSAEFYDNSLTADVSVQHHLLSDLPNVTDTPLTNTPLTYIDTAGASYDDEPEQDGPSTLNPEEAKLVAKKVEQLLAAGVSAEAIGVITPYGAQVRYLRDVVPETIEVNSIDGFQGREKEAIILSLVRANREGAVGFLAETRRINVAMTRARRKLIVIGDSATLTQHPFFAKFVDYCEAHDAYHSVWEEMYE